MGWNLSSPSSCHDSYTANVTRADGSVTEMVWEPTHFYASGRAEAPTGGAVVGGKEGFFMKWFDNTALTLVIIGAINWLLVGIFRFDLVAFLSCLIWMRNRTVTYRS